MEIGKTSTVLAKLLFVAGEHYGVVSAFSVMERGRGCYAGSVLLLKYYLLLHESRMMNLFERCTFKYKSREVVKNANQEVGEGETGNLGTKVMRHS